MRVKVDIAGSACGNDTTVIATSEDGMYVGFDIQSECEKINILAAMLMARSPVRARDEINPMNERGVMDLIRSVLTGACVGCAVPVGIVRSMQVAAGLARPRNIAITFTQESEPSQAPHSREESGAEDSARDD